MVHWLSIHGNMVVEQFYLDKQHTENTIRELWRPVIVVWVEIEVVEWFCSTCLTVRNFNLFCNLCATTCQSKETQNCVKSSNYHPTSHSENSLFIEMRIMIFLRLTNFKIQCTTCMKWKWKYLFTWFNF